LADIFFLFTREELLLGDRLIQPDPLIDPLGAFPDRDLLGLV
jgi:hypothetical protein